MKPKNMVLNKFYFAGCYAGLAKFVLLLFVWCLCFCCVCLFMSVLCTSCAAGFFHVLGCWSFVWCCATLCSSRQVACFFHVLRCWCWNRPNWSFILMQAPWAYNLIICTNTNTKYFIAKRFLTAIGWDNYTIQWVKNIPQIRMPSTVEHKYCNLQ